jgi:hypothetical protein
MPWPWPGSTFFEILILDPGRLAATSQERWLAECRRILEPDGLLRVFWPATAVLGDTGKAGYGRVRSEVDAGTASLRFRRLAADQGWRAAWTTERGGVTATLMPYGCGASIQALSTQVVMR